MHLPALERFPAGDLYRVLHRIGVLSLEYVATKVPLATPPFFGEGVVRNITELKTMIFSQVLTKKVFHWLSLPLSRNHLPTVQCTCPSAAKAVLDPDCTLILAFTETGHTARLTANEELAMLSSDCSQLMVELKQEGHFFLDDAFTVRRCFFMQWISMYSFPFASHNSRLMVKLSPQVSDKEANEQASYCAHIAEMLECRAVPWTVETCLCRGTEVVTRSAGGCSAIV